MLICLNKQEKVHFQKSLNLCLIYSTHKIIPIHHLFTLNFQVGVAAYFQYFVENFEKF